MNLNYDFLEQNELQKIFNRFKKIRAEHNYGYRNLLPIKEFTKRASGYQQLQLNTNFHFNAIIMDIDDEDMLTEWNSIGLPTPTIQTINKNNNKAHLVWLLNTPVWKEHKHVVSYYKSIVNSMKLLLGADIAYQNHSTKNFLNTDMYRVTYNDVAYDLGDFREFIIPEHKEDKYNTSDEDSALDLIANSRHIYLFEKLRRYGYRVSPTSRDIQAALIKKAQEINSCFETPINIKYIVKSVNKFCEENKANFSNSKKRARVMKFEKIKNLSKEEYKEEVKTRQSKSATRTTTIKKLKTASKIKVAIDTLLRQKQIITPQNIAELAKISISTARRNIRIIKIFTQKTKGFIRSIRMIVLGAKQTCCRVNNSSILVKTSSRIEIKCGFI